MRAIAGVFPSRGAAEHGYQDLRRAGYDPDDINFLTPGATADQVRKTPVSETEQPGVGKALGGLVGGAIGAAGGFELGVAATALIPGVGPVLAAGLAGMALLGAGGAMAGAAAGSKAEQDTTPGLPVDEVFFYEDALRQGRSVIAVMANGATEAKRAQEILAEAGAETIDAAREAWWMGLRSAESEHYQALGKSFEADQADYRAGFEAALRRPNRGKPYAAAAEQLKSAYPGIWDSEPFRAGYARGQEFHRQRIGVRRQ